MEVTDMQRTGGTMAEECPVRVNTRSAALDGSLCIPKGAVGIVLFAHGSGSSRLSPRNRFVAKFLQDSRMGTLLFDLLTPDEESIDEQTGRLRFDIPFLTNRLVEVTDWLTKYPGARDYKLGYFGASTGAAAALEAAAQRPAIIRAVVSRGGRPDLAEDALATVKAPTLLIVGGEDSVVIDMNREALSQLKTEKALVIIPGATHLFEEPGALSEVARLANDWFLKHFIGHAH
jgi:putative phosphoribosyl transferase